MRVIQQVTLARPVSLSGVGLHTGMMSRVTLRPAAENAGVQFHKVDASAKRAGAPIAASAAMISDTRLGTSLRSAEGWSVRTVEHLMAAIVLASIDNIDVEINGDEMPILDGSAAPFLEALARAGTRVQRPIRTALKILAPIELSEGDRIIHAEPFDGRLIDVIIHFEDRAIGTQSVSFDLDDPAAIRKLAVARTFCRLADVTAMRSAGLGLGGALDNAIVVDDGKVLNETPLRDPDEFALHKALDLIGDLALAGSPIIGRIRAVRPGHDLNARFLRRLLADTVSIERVPAGISRSHATA